MKNLVDAWYGESKLLGLLIPLSWAYRMIVALKRRWYTIRGQARFNVPIIVVGNITVGGTGKTPLLIALANLLVEQGYRPGIVSRGYGGKPSRLPLCVTSHTSPVEAGDEPVLIAQKTNCPVVVSPKRVAAIKMLIDTYHCNIVLSDDGMQHYQMHRDIEIAVIDGKRRFGNQRCLPAGPLREPMSRLKRVDFMVTQGVAAQGEYQMQLMPEAIYALSNSARKLNLAEAQKNPVHAVAGIGHPERFFNQLREMGFVVIPHAFPDHYYYQPTDINFKDKLPVIMTEKDAVKCKAFATSRHWCLPVQAQCDDVFFEDVLKKLGAVLS